MFTFCFTTIAAAQMRRIRKTRKTTSDRSVKRGLASLAIILVLASVATAGGHPGGGSNGGNHGSSMFSQSGSNSFKTQKTFDVQKLNTQKPITLNNLNSNNNTRSFDLNKGIGLKDLKVTSNDKGTRILDSSKLGNVLIGKGNNGNNPLKVLNSDKHDKNSLNSFCKIKSCHPCPWWSCWNYPCWSSLYHCGCGYYYNVPVVIIREGLDLQLLAVRAIDNGDAGNGPAFRVWLRNNSLVTIDHPFNVLVLAARDVQPTADLPQAGVRVDNIGPGQTIAVDIRLPITANQSGLPMIHVLVDSHREIPEVNEANNGLVINRGEILPTEATGGAQPVAAQGTAPAAAAPVANATEGSALQFLTEAAQ